MPRGRIDAWPTHARTDEPSGQAKLAPVLGRRAELAAFGRMLAAAATGRPQAVVVSGEPGIGKTTLLREFRRLASRSGFGVLSGQAAELERDVPFGLFIDAFETPTRTAWGVEQALGAPGLRELELLVPGLAQVADGSTPALDVERHRIHGVVRAVLTSLARHRPLLLVLDDLHWADPASIELVSFLLRHRERRVMLACACRPTQLDRRLAETLEVLERAGELERLEPGPLTPDEAAELLGASADQDRFSELYTASGGNPFYLEQLGRVAVARRHDLPRLSVADERAVVPAAVRVAIADELAELSPEARRVLEAAAAAGELVEREFVAALCDLDDATSRERFGELLASGLLVPAEVAGRLRFRHPIVRGAVYDATSPGRRLEAHASAARELARRGAPLALRAHHVERSAAPGDETAVALLSDAGAAAAPRAPAAAARWLAAAVRLLPADADRERRYRLTVRLATALAMIGRIQQSRSVLAQVLAETPPESLHEHGSLTVMLARMEQALGRGEEARRLLVAARAQPARDDRERITLTLELAQNHLMMREWDSAIDAAREAHGLACTIGDHELRVAAAASLAYIAQYQGPEWEAEAESRRAEAARGLDAAEDHELTPLWLESLATLAYAEVALERLPEAARRLERGLRLCRAHGNAGLLPRFIVGLAAARLLSGDLRPARESAELASEIARMQENDQAIAFAEGMRAWIAALQGERHAAQLAGEHAVRAAERAPRSLYDWMAHACCGEALLLCGEPDRGRERLLRAGGSGLSDIPPHARIHWYSVLALAELGAGRLEAADAVTRRAEDAISATTMRRQLRADAEFARACVLDAQGAFRLAAETARRSGDGYRAAGMPLLTARADLVRGRALARAGDRTGALLALRSAHTEFLACGAHRLRDEAASELRAAGGRVAQPRARRAPSRAGAVRLSAREQQVVEGIARGQTNRQIASDLFVAEKTVEKHVGRVLAKLGVKSRAAAAATFERLRSADQVR
jgi:ATP/maltotriose-dependent transcriptional regulator MalT